MKRYKVKEIFGPTIEGEGSQTGRVVKFVRFAGCNRWNGLETTRAKSVCSFCDTDFVGGEMLTASQIVERVKALPTESEWISLSGGEPTLQLDHDLLLQLKLHRFSLILETNGSNAIAPFRTLVDHITVSPKQPWGETKLRRSHDLKLLFPWLPGVTPTEFGGFSAVNKYVQPVMGDKYAENLTGAVNFLLKNPAWRLSLQVHKILGVE